MGQENYQIWGSVSYKKGTGTLAVHRFVKLASGVLEPVSGATDIALGVILVTTLKTDVPIPVIVCGIAPVEVGAAGVTESTYIKNDATGKAVDATPANAEVVRGIALETAASGALATCLIFPQALPAS